MYFRLLFFLLDTHTHTNTTHPSWIPSKGEEEGKTIGIVRCKEKQHSLFSWSFELVPFARHIELERPGVYWFLGYNTTLHIQDSLYDDIRECESKRVIESDTFK